jgi:hypothetical protein
MLGVLGNKVVDGVIEQAVQLDGYGYGGPGGADGGERLDEAVTQLSGAGKADSVSLPGQGQLLQGEFHVAGQDPSLQHVLHVSLWLSLSPGKMGGCNKHVN